MQPVSDDIIKKEFQRSTERFQVGANWIGLVLNLLWFISDLIILPSYARSFFFFRLSVSLFSFFVLVFRSRFRITISTSLFILVLGISVQNAYMWSVMNMQEFQSHAFAYMVLFVGVGML